jgi:hypothetical protein
MLVACWSPKGGCGTTVVTAALGVLLAAGSPSGALVADLCGDVPTVLGTPDGDGPGLAGWLTAGPDVGADALARIERTVAPGLSLLAWAGPAPTLVESARADALAAALAADPRPVVADCGVVGGHRDEPATTLAAAAGLSLLVLRPCYLALRRAIAAPLRPSGVVLVNEPGRVLGRSDVEDLLGVPVRAEIDVDPSVARAVDAGLLAGRLPKGLERALRAAA